jgi:SOS regulatory protein LexA
MFKNTTYKQDQTLLAIQDFMSANGRAPMIAELADIMALEYSVLSSRLSGLQAKGFLAERPTARPVPLSITERGLLEVGAAVPIIGEIRGGPISEAIEEPSGILRLPRAHRGARKLFALHVVGDSMSERICQDDVVLLEHPSREPRAGEITAVQVGSSTTLKYFYRVGNNLRLESEHPKYEPIHCLATDARILGFYVGHMSPEVATLFSQ